MSRTISLVNTSADTWQILINTVNNLANGFSVEAATVNTTANGALTTGNGFVEGVFGSRTLVANTLRGGTVQNPGVLTISSNVNMTSNTFTLGGIVINTTAITVSGGLLEPFGASFTATTTGTTAQEIDNFNKLTYRSCDYVLSIKDNNANAYQASKVLTVHDGSVTVAHVVEYSILYTNTAMGVMSANANSTHVKLYFAPVSTNTSVTGTKILMEI